MGLFGGSSQTTSTNNNIMDFNPVFNIGDGNSARQDKQLDATQTVSPKLEDSFGLSASVGVGVGGGSGSGGTATTTRATDGASVEGYNTTANPMRNAAQPMGTASASGGNILSNINPNYLVYGGVGIVALILLSKKKKR